jgi:hypothetical protein
VSEFSPKAQELGKLIAVKGKELSDYFQAHEMPGSEEFNDEFLRRTQEFKKLLDEWKNEVAKP